MWSVGIDTGCEKGGGWWGAAEYEGSENGVGKQEGKSWSSPNPLQRERSDLVKDSPRRMLKLVTTSKF